MERLPLLVIVMIATGCATKNTVQHIVPVNSIIKYQDESAKPKRFSNLYPKKPSYPMTCTGNCYPASSWVKCEQPAENCQFTAKQLKPQLNTGYKIRWLGHASFLINSPEGTNLLVDPVSEQFDWPVNWAFWLSEGFNRKPPTWPAEAELATTDAVLYSHIHYDHFNKDDLQRLGTHAEYYVPLGFANHFPKNGYQINEMAWFSTKKQQQLNIHFVPAHHFSNRILMPYLYEDNNTTLWSGWIIEYQGKRLFFAGDTGYSQHFKDIQQRYGDMDVCLLPIASYYHPENADWYRYVHTTPEDALTASQELNCKIMIPWGYGNASWKMGDHSSHSALLRLLHMHKEMQSNIPLYILNEGDTVQF
ncbi:MBL fold metallo-hydrolase [Shewanella surugensis]|uniref:MBL fold metallo-hydrolase n=1 Tax=Shewanella surugensis TaxID=212020 RepID=A0ABT0L5R9_9GAMM|nr:MBL fold metallo-hydrolase [Shewanella surugensis]MCL1123033.1 MBL fold metallo-hydrolase [Shewanella surugensis]